MEKLIDKDGTELFEFEIEIIPSCFKKIEYIAEDKEEAKRLFLENNEDLDEHDIHIKQTTFKRGKTK